MQRIGIRSVGGSQEVIAVHGYYGVGVQLMDRGCGQRAGRTFSRIARPRLLGRFARLRITHCTDMAKGDGDAPRRAVKQLTRGR
eukprot:5179870-Pleurochrysis_carterae.AAC.1